MATVSVQHNVPDPPPLDLAIREEAMAGDERQRMARKAAKLDRHAAAAHAAAEAAVERHENAKAALRVQLAARGLA